MKIIGKPYSGKPNVRFDGGDLEIELLATTPALYSTVILKIYTTFRVKNKKRDFGADKRNNVLASKRKRGLTISVSLLSSQIVSSTGSFDYFIFLQSSSVLFY